METSQASMSESRGPEPRELVPAAATVPVASSQSRVSFRHAWRDGDEIFIDGRSVGNLHSEGLLMAARRLLGDCRGARTPLESGMVGELPGTLSRFLADEDRNRLLIRLTFAARRLAESRLRPMGRRGLRCQQCEKTFEDGPMTHGPNCVAGEVLDLLDRLQAAEPPSQQQGGAA